MAYNPQRHLPKETRVPAHIIAAQQRTSRSATSPSRTASPTRMDASWFHGTTAPSLEQLIDTSAIASSLARSVEVQASTSVGELGPESLRPVNGSLAPSSLAFRVPHSLAFPTDSTGQVHESKDSMEDEPSASSSTSAAAAPRGKQPVPVLLPEQVSLKSFSAPRILAARSLYTRHQKVLKQISDYRMHQQQGTVHPACKVHLLQIPDSQFELASEARNLQKTYQEAALKLLMSSADAEEKRLKSDLASVVDNTLKEYRVAIAAAPILEDDVFQLSREPIVIDIDSSVATFKLHFTAELRKLVDSLKKEALEAHKKAEAKSLADAQKREASLNNQPNEVNINGIVDATVAEKVAAIERKLQSLTAKQGANPSTSNKKQNQQQKKKKNNNQQKAKQQDNAGKSTSPHPKAKQSKVVDSDSDSDDESNSHLSSHAKSSSSSSSSNKKKKKGKNSQPLPQNHPGQKGRSSSLKRKSIEGNEQEEDSESVEPQGTTFGNGANKRQVNSNRK
jgi:hypothetical protein